MKFLVHLCPRYVSDYLSEKLLPIYSFYCFSVFRAIVFRPVQRAGNREYPQNIAQCMWILFLDFSFWKTVGKMVIGRYVIKEPNIIHEHFPRAFCSLYLLYYVKPRSTWIFYCYNHFIPFKAKSVTNISYFYTVRINDFYSSWIFIDQSAHNIRYKLHNIHTLTYIQN